MMKNLLTFSMMMLTSLSTSADPIDLAKAKGLAANLSVNEPVLVAKAVRTEAKARKLSAKVQAAAPYYIFSRGEGQGFVIVSGDDCLPEILGYTESGDFDEEELPPYLAGWLNHYKMLIEDAQEAGQNVSRQSAKRKNAPRHIKGLESIDPLLTTHWHQTSPYNDRCPITDKGNRAVTGCVATAASQVIYYYRKDNPDTFLATTPTYGADQWHHTAVTDKIEKGTPIKWDLMLDKYGGGEPSEFRQAVADLVFAVGAMDHMDYYDSSGAQISDLVAPMNTYFNLLSECEYKSDGSSSWVPLATWEKKIYDDLAAGHPIIYTGYKDEATGGHAVVLDGYQSSTGLFHFNFGWGGQGDGWYTVDDETGMNYFRMWQGMTYKVRPKKQNVATKIALSEGFYLNHKNAVTVEVLNNSTLGFSGLYLFASTSSSKPTNLLNAKSSNKETIIAPGESAQLTLTAKPTIAKTWYLTVTDRDLNILAQTTVKPQVAPSDLRLEGLSVAASADVEEFEGDDYQVIYNTESVVKALLYNATDVAYEGTMRMYFYTYDDTENAWKEVGFKTGKVAIGEKSMGEASFSMLSTSSCPFEKDKYYYGVLANPVPSTDDTIRYEMGTDTVVRFVLKEGDMEVVSFEDDCLTLKGHFDVTAFNSVSFAAQDAYRLATVYDLTQCTGVGMVSQNVNPNALIYVADDSRATGVNVVRAGQCEHLVLTPGYNFTPRAEFVAERAEITLGETPARWYILTSPFEVTVPSGMIAREILSHTALTGITNKTRDVKTLEAGKTYLVMSSSSRNMVLTAEHVKVVVAPVENTDVAVVGTLVNAVTPDGAQLLNEDEKLSFVPVDEGTEAEALRGYWYADDLTKAFRAYSSVTLDPAYVILAQSIEEAYGILEKYRGITKETAYTNYLSEIEQAAIEFSKRGEEATLTNASAIKKYATQLLEDGVAYMKQIEDAGNMEIDFTSNIVNPSFEAGTGKPKGWTLGTKEGYNTVGAVVLGTAANANRAVGLDGANVFQSLIAKADSSSVSISQVVEGLTPGYYRLTAMLGTDVDATVTMFAGDSTVTVAGHPFGHYYLTQAMIENIPVEATDGEETGTLNIGVQEGRWYKADHFTLTYTGAFKSEEDATIIVDIANDVLPVRHGIYTLQGVKVTKMTLPGIYIIDGKKYYHR